MVVETIIDWTLFQKKQGLRIWNFQGYWRNGKWIFQGLTKNNMKFPGALVLGLNISKGWKNYLWSFSGWSLVLSGISRVELKRLKIPGVFQKCYVLNSLCLFLLWNSLYTFYVWIDYFKILLVSGSILKINGMCPIFQK